MRIKQQHSSLAVFQDRTDWIQHRQLSEAETIWAGFGYDELTVESANPAAHPGTPDGGWYIIGLRYEPNVCAEVPAGGWPTTALVIPVPIVNHLGYSDFPHHDDDARVSGPPADIIITDCNCTRWYFTQANLIQPAADPNWDVAGADVGFTGNALNATPQDSYLSTANSVSTAGGGGVTTDVNLSQHAILMDSTLAALVAAGGATVRAQARASARNGIGVSEAAQDLITQISIRVIQSDGTTVRGTALALQTHATSSGLAKWAAQNPPDNRVFPPQGATALAAVAGAVAGDYLVVELGYRNFTVEAVTGGAIYLYDSSTAGDLPEGNSSTAVLNSWIEICA